MDSRCLNRNIKVTAKEYQRIKERMSTWRHSFKFSEEALAKMRKKRVHTDNMKKPKTRTPALLAEFQRRRDSGFYKKENNPRFKKKYAWYNDGIRNYGIEVGKPHDNLVKGRIIKPKVRYTYNNMQFYTIYDLYKYFDVKMPFTTWKRHNYSFIQSCKL